MFSSATRYAIRAILFLAAYSNSKNKLGSTEIAKKMNVKQPFLAKILQKMARNNLISSSKGPKGGFYLSQKNKKQNLISILMCFDDLKSFETCVLGFTECSNNNPCPLHIQAYAYREGMRYQFMHQTIEELAKKAKELELKI